MPSLRPPLRSRGPVCPPAAPLSASAAGHAGTAIGHDVVTTNTFENNGTTLGIHSSRRPLS